MFSTPIGHEFSEKDFVILTVANLVPIKGIEYLMQAVNKINDASIKLLIVGNNKNEYGQALLTENTNPNIIFIDKENAHNRKGIFMIDAGKGFIKDGNKNRLREQDIKRITDVFTAQKQIKGFSRMVSITEIVKNEYNLNIPRYIDNQEKEDIQDIKAHLKGGIPITDIDDLSNFWEIYPTLRKSLFEEINEKYSKLTIENEQIKDEIYSHPEFESFINQMDSLFEDWQEKNTQILKALDKGNRPKEVIAKLSTDLLQTYHNKALIDKYNVYQWLMTYWNETMQDDCYIVSADGWVAETYRILVANKAKKMIDKGWACDLVPKELIINRYFETEKKALESFETEKESIANEVTELEEEHNTEDGYFGEIEKISKTNVDKRYKALKKEEDTAAEELEVLKQYINLHTKLSNTNKKIKQAEAALDEKLYAKYPTLSETEVKQLVVNDKWMQTIENAIKGEIDHISQRLTNRIKELAERYATPLPQIDQEATDLEDKVKEVYGF